MMSEDGILILIGTIVIVDIVYLLYPSFVAKIKECRKRNSEELSTPIQSVYYHL